MNAIPSLAVLAQSAADTVGATNPVEEKLPLVAAAFGVIWLLVLVWLTATWMRVGRAHRRAEDLARAVAADAPSGDGPVGEGTAPDDA